jgi:two-component system response regulator YesN
MKVIIVEDEKRASRGLRNLLESLREDIEVTAQAPDGTQALELIRVLKPDVVFTDIRMQSMDGLSLIREVRKFDRKTRFVIISAYEEFDYARQALSLDVEDYLVKPVTEEEVRQLLLRLSDEIKGEQEREKAKEKAEKKSTLRELYSHAHPVVMKALDFIEEEYADRVNQKELAEKLGVSPEYFSYLFARDIKVNFSRFLRQYRIEMAVRLLDQGETSLEEVARKAGFSDKKYFCKCFKEEKGISVGEYRRSV